MRIGLRHVWLALAGLVLCALANLTSPAAAQVSDQPSLEAIKATVEEIDRTVARDDVTSEALAEARQKLNAAADALRAKIEELEPRLHEIEERLKQLGPAPEKDQPPEAAEIAKERKELTATLAEVQGALKQARVLLVHVDQLSERVAEKRHVLYARELFARSASALDPFFWAQAFRALPVEISRATALLEWWMHEQKEPGRLAAALIMLLGLATAAIMVSRRWHARVPNAGDGSPSAKAWSALRIFALFALRTPLPAAAGLLLLGELGVLNFRLEQILQGIVAGIAVAAFGHAVARALFAVDRPQARLVREDDATARCFHNHLLWASRLLGLVIALQVVHKVLFAPLVLTIATNVLFGALTTACLLHLVLRLDRLKRAGGVALPAAAWAHPLGLLMAVVILLALLAGYSAFAAFVSLRVIVAAAVFGALYLFLVATQMFFDGFGEQSAKGQKLAASLGVTARSLALGGTLVSAALRVMLILLSFVVIIGPWEVSTADLFDTVRNIPFGFKIGDLRLSVREIIGAAVVLTLLLLATRLMQRWLERELLPRTRIEPSLQLSIVTIFGYIGAITAIALALAGLGVDLQKIAFIAGALSVGIGFAIDRLQFRLRPHPVDRAADPGGRYHRGEGRRGLGAARARARDRNRDLRSRERDYPKFRAHHRRGEELDARQYARPHPGEGSGLL